MAYQIEPESCAEDTLLTAKLKCLELAAGMWRSPDNSTTADQIVSDATEFWDFLTGEEAQSETGH